MKLIDLYDTVAEHVRDCPLTHQDGQVIAQRTTSDSEIIAWLTRLEELTQTEPDRVPEDPAPTWHKLFRDTTLKENRAYVRLQNGTEAILRHVDAQQKELGLSRDDHDRPSGSDILDWYGNGPTPKPRPGLLALLHPQFHKRGWRGIYETAEACALKLKRWIWIVEAGGSRWYMILAGDDPDVGDASGDGSPAWRAAVCANDQYIGVISPEGVFRILGCS